ncbi:MAG: BufA1 family periplasmic bufferin-type metallophore [Polaromonas sp.]
MDKRQFTTTALSTAMGLAFGMLGVTASAQGTKDMPPIVKENMERMAKEKLEKCYGINAVAKNDCAEGEHSCAGHATKARETKSFVMLPAGVCSKIAGGSLKPS